VGLAFLLLDHPEPGCAGHQEMVAGDLRTPDPSSTSVQIVFVLQLGFSFVTVEGGSKSNSRTRAVTNPGEIRG